MPTQQKLSFGIKTAQQMTTYEEILPIWLEADEIPIIEHAWLFDHFMPIGSYDPTGPCLEGWSMLAALAARTKHLRMGLMVTGNTYRHPAVLANMVATIDIISQGRLDVGMGAGWNEREHGAYGIPLYAPGERIRRMGEACEVMRLMWTEEAPNFDGKYYQLKEAYCNPKPVQKPHPPFVIGGSGEKLTLRMVAQYASIWNFVGGSVDDFNHKNAVLDNHCVTIGRDPATIARSIQIVINADDLSVTYDTIQSYVTAGATHIILNLRNPYPAGIVPRLVKEIIEPMKAANEG